MLRPVFELLPAVATVLHASWPGTDPGIALSLITTVLGVGTFVGVLCAPVLAQRFGARRMIGITAVATCVCIAGIGVLRGSYDLPVLLCVTGFFVLVKSVIVQMLVHFESDNAYRGRAISLQSMIFRGAPALGALLLGGLAEQIGLGNALLGCPALAICMLTFVLASIPAGNWDSGATIVTPSGRIHPLQTKHPQ